MNGVYLSAQIERSKRISVNRKRIKMLSVCYFVRVIKLNRKMLRFGRSAGMHSNEISKGCVVGHVLIIASIS